MSITYKYNVNSHTYTAHVVQALTKDHILPNIFFPCAAEIAMYFKNSSNYSYVWESSPIFGVLDIVRAQWLERAP